MEDLWLTKASFIYTDKNFLQIHELMARGEDPNKQIKGKFTPFQTAVLILEDNIEVVQELIKAGADVNFADNLGYTPLHIAVILQKLRVIIALLKSGAFINAKNSLGKTPLHYAVSKFTQWHPPFHRYRCSPNTRIIKMLLDTEDIDCNSVDSNGDTALMMAVKEGQFESVVILLHNKANPNICNNNLETPLRVAFANYSNLISNELILHGACIFAKDKYGHTPIDNLIMNVEIGIWSVTIDLLIKVKILAFKHCESEDLKSKLQFSRQISQFFEKYCEEVNHMKTDYISGNITVYDFVSNQLISNHFENFNFQIQKRVVERLTRDLYPEYFYDILKTIPRSSLFTILETFSHSKKNNLIIYLVSNWVSDLDIFRLIVAFSNVEISETMRNLDVREICAIYR